MSKASSLKGTASKRPAAALNAIAESKKSKVNKISITDKENHENSTTSMMMSLSGQDLSDESSESPTVNVFEHVWDKISQEATVEIAKDLSTKSSSSNPTPSTRASSGIDTADSSVKCLSGLSAFSKASSKTKRKKATQDIAEGIRRVDRMVNDELIKEIEIDCPLSLQDVEFDRVVERKLLDLSCMEQRLLALRKVRLVLIIDGGRVPIDEIQNCINRLLFHYILMDCDRSNAIDAVIQDIGLIGGFVAGRQLIKPRLYEFLLRLPKQVIYEPSQNKHEHFKDCLRKAISYLGVHGGQYHVTHWVDDEMIQTLMKATQDWRPDNTFAKQQLHASKNGKIIKFIFNFLVLHLYLFIGSTDEPQTIFEFIILSVGVCCILDENFFMKCSPYLMAFLFERLVEYFDEVKKYHFQVVLITLTYS